MKNFLLYSLLLIAQALMGQEGYPDASFGVDGYITQPVDYIPGYRQVYDLAVLPDGKILACGHEVLQGVIDTMTMAVLKYLSDGQSDSTFGQFGNAQLSFGTHVATAQSIALMPDGRFILGGRFMGSTDGYLAARFWPSGKIDTTFGDMGKVWLAIGASYQPFKMKMQADGKIVFADYNAIRLDTTGALDLHFGNNGLANGTIVARCLAFQPDQKIVLGGYYGNAVDYAVARLLPDGQFDLDFGTNGILVIPTGNSTADFVNDIVLQPDGKIIVAGDRYLARVLENGVVDPDFGVNGISQIIMHSYEALALQPDGKIIVVGNKGVYRFLENGVLDTTFGVAGIASINDNRWTAVEILPDGKILVGGDHSFDGVQHFKICRILAELTVHADDFADHSDQVLFYPNPVDVVATVEYELRQASDVRFQLYDIEGKFISDLLSEVNQPPGLHKQQVAFPGNLSEGYYVLRIITGQGSVAIRVLKQ